jgi:hypothetical protein
VEIEEECDVQRFARRFGKWHCQRSFRSGGKPARRAIFVCLVAILCGGFVGDGVRIYTNTSEKSTTIYNDCGSGQDALLSFVDF